MRFRPWETASALVFLLGMARNARADASDGILLTVEPGSSPDEVALSWTGNQPTFQVFRATNPASVTGPSNLVIETDARAWIETPPLGDLFYYEIARKPDPPASIVLGVPDRILLAGTVVGPVG